MSLQSTGGAGSPAPRPVRVQGDGLQAEIQRLGPWFHNLRLPGGALTASDHPLGDFPAYKWEQIAPELPNDLRGCHALDVGCNAGFYSFELAKRGAHVLAIDHDEHYLTQARWAATQLALEGHIDFRLMDVYDLPRLNDTFDIVFFMGVLYHLRYPLLGLDLVAERVSGTLVLQTLTMADEDGFEAPADLAFDERDRLRDRSWPAMAFVEHHLAGDHTNWWVPSTNAVEAMVRTTGLRIVARPGHEIWVCERSRPTHHQDELERATGRRLRR